MTDQIDALIATRAKLEAEAKAINDQIAAEMAAARAGVIQDVKDDIAKFDLKPAEVFEPAELRMQASPKASVKTKASKATAAVRYMDQATGATWVGKGKRPGWLRDAINAGRTLDQYRIAA